ncbi:MAG TPA: PIG-L family deacetylase, partial [Anaerolineaceae bacterium]
VPTWVSGTDGKSPVYLFLSPHLDDAVLSCGGLIARLGAAGERVVVATIFTGDLGPGMPVSWLASRNQRAWRLPERPFAVRQHEDRRAVSALGAEAVHIGLLDGMYRGKMDPVTGRIQPYYPEDTVGVGVDPEDGRIIGEQIKRAMNQLFKMYCGDAGLRVFCPVGYSGHVDHQLVRKEAEVVFGQQSLVYYEEHPYATRQETDLKPDFLGQDAFQGMWNPKLLMLTHAEVERRISAAACYVSQIPGLYPSMIERGLEILAARIPSIGEAVWSMHWKGKDFRASRERMANVMRESIARFGGEKYWVLETQAEGEKQLELSGKE